jgi:hypothetical protein
MSKKQTWFLLDNLLAEKEKLHKNMFPGVQVLKSRSA